MPVSYTKEYNVPKGRVYFAPDESGSLSKHEERVGDASELNFSVTTEEIEHESHESGIGEVDDTTFIKTVRVGSLVVDHISKENLARFFIGSNATVSQTGASVTDEAITVKQGREYQLGQSSSIPTGRRGVSNVVVTGTGGTPTYTVTTDYTVDAALGRIAIVSGGGIPDDTALEVDYDYATNSRNQVSSNQSITVTGALRYIADNPKGTNRDYYFPKVQLGPDGDFSVIASEYTNLPFTVKVNTRDGYAQLYIDDRAA